jgi:chemotaxis protein methyltransferase CheR
MKIMLAETDYNVTDADFRRISDMVYKYCGINLHDGKKQLVRARIAKRLRSGGFRDLPSYLDFVRSDSTGNEFALLIDAMSTNLTSFYREPDHFRYLAEVGLPETIARKQKTGDNRLRLWSAGGSTGEEPCTLAMTVLDTIKNPDQWDIKILATDISTHVLKIARCGFYSPQRLETLPAGYKERFFQSRVVNEHKGFSVAPQVQQMISFRHLNLMESWPFNGPFDFIFCRNVMIYFDKPTQERLVNRYWDVLAPGGVLFTGHSESLTGVEHKFKYIKPTIYGKQ